MFSSFREYEAIKGVAVKAASHALTEDDVNAILSFFRKSPRGTKHADGKPMSYLEMYYLWNKLFVDFTHASINNHRNIFVSLKSTYKVLGARDPLLSFKICGLFHPMMSGPVGKCPLNREGQYDTIDD